MALGDFLPTDDLIAMLADRGHYVTDAERPVLARLRSTAAAEAAAQIGYSYLDVPAGFADGYRALLVG